MKKSITQGFKKAIGHFRDQNEKKISRSSDKIVVSHPVQQSSASTSALLPDSAHQLNDCLKKCSVSSIFLKRLIQTKRFELVSEAVTEIFKQTMIMLEATKPRNGDSESSESSIWMNQQQQLARQYLATLVKLSDNLSVTSSETEIALTGEMVDQLLEILKMISSEARDRLPSYERTNKSIHNSMEELQLDSPDEFDRGSIRRSFRTIKRRLSSKTNVRSHQSTDRLVKRRPIIGRSQSVKRSSNYSNGSSSFNQTEQSDKTKSTDSILDINWSSRPCSSASFDHLSNCSSNIPIFDSDSTLAQGESEIPPQLPPKEYRPPLGGIHVYTPLKVKSNVDRRLLLDETDSFNLESVAAPALPLKKSPSKSCRDSGYDMTYTDDNRKPQTDPSTDQNIHSSGNQVTPTTNNVTPYELLDLILSGAKTEKDLLEIFLSSYRTFMTVHEILDALLKRIRLEDSSYKNQALQILIRVIDQMIHTELTPDVHQTLSDEIFWMMTHRESEFMKFAQKLRDNIRKKWNTFEDIIPLPAPDEEVIMQLRDCGERLLEFSSERVAEQLTLVEADNFRAVDSSEFVISSMYDTFDREKVPNFAKAVDHFNNLSYWTQGIILSQTKDSQDLREKIIWKLLNVLHHLQRLKNYNSYFALVSGVSSYAVTRLNWSKSIFTERIKDCQALTDLDKNFMKYREELRIASPPCLPYIGLIKQDLYQVHLREKTIIENGCVNISKARKLHAHLESIRRFRNSKYDFQKNGEILKVFGGFRCIHNEDVLWKLSYSLKKEEL